jgi:hypothetical protein
MKRRKTTRSPSLSNCYSRACPSSVWQYSQSSSSAKGTSSAPKLGGRLSHLVVLVRLLHSLCCRLLTGLVLSIGQWAPIVGTGLAVLGSLYVLLAEDLADLAALKKRPNETIDIRHCDCHDCQNARRQGLPSHHPMDVNDSPRGRRSRSIHDDPAESPPQERMPTFEVSEHSPDAPPHSVPGAGPAGLSEKMDGATGQQMSSVDQPPPEQGAQSKHSWLASLGMKVARGLDTASNYISTSAQDHFSDHQWTGEAEKYPQIPGEEQRNPELARMRKEYGLRRDRSPHPERHRAASFVSVASASGIEASSSTQRAISPQRPPLVTLQRGRPTGDFQTPPTSPTSPIATSPGATRPRRRDTLEPPMPTYPTAYPSSSRRDSPPTHIRSMSVPEGQASPAIVVSSDRDTISPEEEKHEDHPT